MDGSYSEDLKSLESFHHAMAPEMETEGVLEMSSPLFLNIEEPFDLARHWKCFSQNSNLLLNSSNIPTCNHRHVGIYHVSVLLTGFHFVGEGSLKHILLQPVPIVEKITIGL